MKYTATEFTKAVPCIVPSTYTVALTTGAAIDTKGFSEALIVLSVGLASTNAELNVQVYEGATTTPATAVAGATFAEVTLSNDKTVFVGRIDLTKRQRYMTATFVADGSNVVRAGLEFILIAPKSGPASQTNTVAFNL